MSWESIKQVSYIQVSHMFETVNSKERANTTILIEFVQDFKASEQNFWLSDLTSCLAHHLCEAHSSKKFL